ncbi:MAG: RluA family pseudouridine synthase [Clostridia bacterium]|nr:RluA family pseudouridine synthase [Clostridia bacterium]
MKYIINENQDKLVLKAFLKSVLGLSSRLIKRLKKYSDAILVNGVHADVVQVLNKGDVLCLDFSDREDDVNEHLEPVDIPIDIIYEDENYTVVNKGPSMPTHQSLFHYTDTLANALAFRYRARPYVFRAINRLDMDTSGIVLTANNMLYADILCEKLKNGCFHKEYIAIVKGKTNDDGEIDAPIARIGDSIIERAVLPNGERAVTRYKTILSCDDISVVRVFPITGRTHQIRVHMAHIGHSIIGDTLYGEKSELISRQALHASRLKIDGIGEFVADLPDDMKNIIRRYFGDYESLS